MGWINNIRGKLFNHKKIITKKPIKILFIKNKVLHLSCV